MVKTATPRNTDSEVLVSVQTESSDRVQGTFLLSTSLWDVLNKLDLTSSIVEDTQPCVIYMRQQITGKQALMSTSLKEVGESSGRASVRFMLIKSANEPVIVDNQPSEPVIDLTNNNEVVTDIEEDAVKEIKDSDQMEVEEVEVKSKPSHSNREPLVGNHGNTELPNDNHGNIEFPVLPFSVFPPTENLNENTIPMEINTPINEVKQDGLEEPHLSDDSFTLREGLTDYNYYGKMILAQVMSRQQSQEVVYDGPCERHPVIFSLDDDSMSVPIADVPDDFYEPTIADVQKMHQDLQKDVKQLSDAPLMTQELRNAKRRCDYRQTVIRVIMPDRMVLQGTFNTGESLKSLVKFVREHLRDEKKKFVLYTTPPKEVLRSAKPTFSDKGFYPAANIHLSMVDGNEGGVADEGGVVSDYSLLSDTSLSQYKKELIQAEELASKHRVVVSKDRTSESNDTNASVENTNTKGSNRLSSNSNKGVSLSSTAKTTTGQNAPKWFAVGRK